MNDTYFALAQYNNSAEKEHVMCQEIGLTFGLTHQEIGDILRLSRVKVTRLLQQAREAGIVHIEVKTDASPYAGLEAELSQTFELAEALATSDFPGGSVNVLTGFADELAPWLAGHMDVNAIDLTGIDGATTELERAAAENVKRVVRSDASSQSPYEIASFLELKTVWHPIGV